MNSGLRKNIRIERPNRLPGLSCQKRLRRISAIVGDEHYQRAFTLIELMVVVLIITTLGALAIPRYAQAQNAAKQAVAIADLRTLITDITRRQVRTGKLPADLTEIETTVGADPWGNPYRYLSFEGISGNGPKRKDKFLVPLNSQYDLYSMGTDGNSMPALQVPVSHDDIIMANDGSFIGLASTF